MIFLSSISLNFPAIEYLVSKPDRHESNVGLTEKEW
jgi:hypothetical protein